MGTYSIRDTRGNKIKDYSLKELSRQYGPIRGISRAALIRLLLGGVQDEDLRMGCTAKRISPREDHVSVTLSDGTAEDFDLVVAADGIHSDTRHMLWSDSEYATWHTGWGGWVVWCDASQAPSDTYIEYWGAGRFAGLYPVKDRTGLFIGGPDTELSELGEVGFVKDLRRRFGGLTEAIAPQLATLAETHNPYFWKFCDVRTEQWVKGRVVLLGDAATGFLPTAGVGASMAMESAAALNDELSRTNASMVPQTLHLYEKSPKAARRNSSEELAQPGQVDVCRLRDASLVARPTLALYSLEMLIKSIARLMREPI